jgi:hypothetical protein
MPMILNGNKCDDIERLQEIGLYIPKTVSVLEAIIYDYVVEHFGESEAQNPSWDITSLAAWIQNYQEEMNNDKAYEQLHTVAYDYEDEEE